MPSPAARKVVWVDTTLYHYRFRFLELLAEELAADGIALTVAASEWDPRGTFAAEDGVPVPLVPLRARGGSLGRSKLAWLGSPTVTGGADLVIMPQRSALLDNYVALARQALGGPRIAFWGHGHTPNTVAAEHPVARRVKESLSRRPHWWFAYTEDVADQVVDFGYPRDRITVVANSTDTSGLRDLLEHVTDEDVASFSEHHGLGDRPLLLFLGTLRENKELPFLLEVGAELARRGSDALVGLSGSGPLDEDMRRRAAEEPWLRHLGENYDHDLAVALRRAHAVVVPAWVGLVALDAMTAGVPFVTRRGAQHPPEVAYLTDGHDALLVDDGGDPVVFADAVQRLLEDEALHERLSDGARRSSRGYSAEAMAAAFAAGIRSALADDPRHRRRGGRRG